MVLNIGLCTKYLADPTVTNGLVGEILLNPAGSIPLIYLNALEKLELKE
jgi:hypothetical protein